jgi:hypothetical protein
MYPGSLIIISARVESIMPSKNTSAMTYMKKGTKEVTERVGAFVSSKSASVSKLTNSTRKIYLDTKSDSLKLNESDSNIAHVQIEN